MTATIIHGDCLDVLRGMADASVDAVVTDPPAGIAFMGKAWDRDKGGRDEWIAWLADIMRECARVMKPGAHAVVWALPRTSHWTGMAIENAGLEVRDKVTHHFGSGFPKSHNLPGGIGTALKPASEDWWVARKPLVGTVAANVAQHGTGAINVDGCRVAANESTRRTSNAGTNGDGWRMGKTAHVNGSDAGRWPPNLLLTHSADCGDACADDCPVAMMDRQSGVSSSRASGYDFRDSNNDNPTHVIRNIKSGVHFGDSGGASRFFPTFDAEPFLYQAKAPKSERVAASDGTRHPTQKPVALMRWLVRLVTPPDGTILDPFAGSGTTLVAALAEGRQAIGIEREAEYVEIVKARLANAEAA